MNGTPVEAPALGSFSTVREAPPIKPTQPFENNGLLYLLHINLDTVRILLDHAVPI